MLNPIDQKYIRSSLPFYEHLSSSQQDLLLSGSVLAHFQKDQMIHYGDQECIGLLLLRHGSIRVFLISEEGREVTLFRLHDGDICVLSASCVLSDIDFEVSIEAESDTDVIQVPSTVFASLTTENVYAELFSYKMAAERFSDVMWAMQQILFVSFDKRLAAFLIEESVQNHSTTIKMTHEQIAHDLGTAREVVTRMLKYFVTEGYLQLSRGTIELQDLEGLKSRL